MIRTTIWIDTITYTYNNQDHFVLYVVTVMRASREHISGRVSSSGYRILYSLDYTVIIVAYGWLVESELIEKSALVVSVSIRTDM